MFKSLSVWKGSSDNYIARAWDPGTNRTHPPHSKKGVKHFRFARQFWKLVHPLSCPLVKFAPLYRLFPMFAPPQFPAFQYTCKACNPLSDPVICPCIDLTGTFWFLEFLIIKEGIRGGNPQKRPEVNNLYQSNTT